MILTTSPPALDPIVAVLADSSEQLTQAKALAKHLRLPLATLDGQSSMLLLTVTAQRLELRSLDPKEGGAVYVDFVTGKNAFRRQHGGGLRQALVRAVGLRGHGKLSIVDATPGLGQDAFVLASLGGRVLMLERSPVVAALLADGLQRLQSHAEQTGMAPTPMALLQADARFFFNFNSGLSSRDKTVAEQGKPPEVIYLDPMYPHRNSSALVKKEMRRLRTLVGNDSDAPELLAAALLYAKKRVVVKRPRLAPPLAGTAPTMAVNSKNTRFDVYLVSGQF